MHGRRQILGKRGQRTGHIVRNRLTRPEAEVAALRPKPMGVIESNARSATYFQDGRMQLRFDSDRTPWRTASTSWRCPTRQRPMLASSSQEILKKEGLRATLKCRRDQFKQYED